MASTDNTEEMDVTEDIASSVPVGEKRKLSETDFDDADPVPENENKKVETPDEKKEEVAVLKDDDSNKDKKDAGEKDSSEPNDKTPETKGDDKKADSGVAKPQISAPAHPEDDPTLNYTQQGNFTSEIFKIKITNLPKKFGFSDLKKMLEKLLGFPPHKLKCGHNSGAAFVCFKNEREKLHALKTVNKHIWKGQNLRAVPATPMPDPYFQAHVEDAESDTTFGEKKRFKPFVDFKKLSPEQAKDLMRDNITPLWRQSYKEQLETKTLSVEDVLRKLTLHHFVRPLSQYRDKRKNEGRACPLLPIIPSPVTKGYRNKNELSIGLDADEKNVMVGFRYGTYKSGNTAVGSCDNLDVTSPRVVAIAESVQAFVRDSGLPPFKYQDNSGHWQTLTVREFTTGDTLVFIDFFAMDLTEVEVDQVKASLTDYFNEGDGKDLNVTSLYIRFPSLRQNYDTCPKRLLRGEQHVFENLLGLKFRISPEAFFQVNSLAAEKLYTVVADWSQLTEETTVFDICCGTGTIGLTMAKKVKEVVGIDSCKQAIQDAKENAKLNEVTNATFYCSKVELIMGKLMSSFPSTPEKNLVAIVDPPRAGLCKTVIKTIRKHKGIQRLIFISCSPESCMDNFADLIRLPTNNLPGQPFTLVQAQPVDLFPGTKHVEVVLLFERDTAQP